MQNYTIIATRRSDAMAEARGKSVTVPLETTATGRHDALAPVELLLAAVAGAVLGGTEHAVVTLRFRLLDATVSVCGRHEGASRTLAIAYDLLLSTDEPDARLVQFHELVRRSDSVQRLGAVGRELTGSLRRQVA
jgi:uncharacterized OsmC-like protein